ncbi:hypothetical protein [Aeromicrobium sp.]|uniref:hypothetical protein n=1 Tax=Aeromicrobium sp. TaxID=1871063 RepID=UPI00198313C5|nr:hypothetical protein [Aeromicrobium sp.]MBC7631147.1 hypothetical protein [Aeromicrobium sp.]
MTQSTRLVSRLRARLHGLFERYGARPTMLVAIATGVLTIFGLIAAATDHDGWALTVVLLVQAGLIAGVLLQRRALARFERTMLQRLDLSTARTLADLTRARHAILTAMDELSAGDGR